MVYKTVLMLHVRHHDNSFNKRFLKIDIESDTKDGMNLLYNKINIFIVKLSDDLKKSGMLPEDIYIALKKIIKDEYGLHSIITENEANLALREDRTVYNTNYSNNECTFDNLMEYIKNH